MEAVTRSLPVKVRSDRTICFRQGDGRVTLVAMLIMLSLY
jgi:hypothetical protein